jgi:hypothetical protein
MSDSKLTIYKYPLTVTDVQIVEIPEGAQLLTAQAQYAQLCFVGAC